MVTTHNGYYGHRDDSFPADEDNWLSHPLATRGPMSKAPAGKAPNVAGYVPPLDYEVYDDGAVGWGWAGRCAGRLMVLSTGHSSRQACEEDIEKFKGTIHDHE